MTQLVGIPYSPWSEKARWALEARHVPYERVVYAPLVGELPMRRRTGNWTGRVSVPVLFDEAGRAIPDSLAIARWADQRGQGPELFPKELEADILRHVELSERALDAGRCLSLHRMLKDDDALREMVPKPLRGVLGGVGPKVAALGIRRTLSKYGAHRVDVKTHETNLIAALEALRAALASAPAAGEPKTLMGRFTFADIAMTQALGFVEPPKFGLRIGTASRRTFTDPVLRERFSDLISWRDAVYEVYRPKN
jgi:glutathione S-transferase